MGNTGAGRRANLSTDISGSPQASASGFVPDASAGASGASRMASSNQPAVNPSGNGSATSHFSGKSAGHVTARTESAPAARHRAVTSAVYRRPDLSWSGSMTT
jgi:hypothetical protein